MKADKRRLVGKTVSKYFPLIQILEKINQKQEVRVTNSRLLCFYDNQIKSSPVIALMFVS